MQYLRRSASWGEGQLREKGTELVFRGELNFLHGKDLWCSLLCDG